MGNTRRTQLLLVALTCGILAATGAMAQPNGYGDPGQQADWAQPDANQMGVNMTLYHVVHGADGQELMVTPSGQAVPLPGAGVAGKRVAVYHGSHGGTWYVDRNGQQVDIPAMDPEFYSSAASGQGNYAPVSPYYNGGYQQYYYPPQQGYGPQGYPQQGYGQQQQPQATASATVNTTGGGNGSGGGGNGLGSFAGGLIGSALGSVAGDLAGGGIPYGAPVYEGGGGPYYYGGGGGRTIVNNNVNSEHFNEWHNQQNWYRNQFNHGGRYEHQSWPGKDHGFPPPWDGKNGRLYGDHRDQNGEGHHEGEGPRQGQGEHREGGGGEHREGGGGEHREGGGGEHRGGGGEHHGGGGGHRGGGGGHRR